MEALVIYKSNSKTGLLDGIEIRAKTIIGILNQCNIRVTLSKDLEIANYLEKKWFLVVVISHVNADLTKKFKNSARYIWLDAMDSMILTNSTGTRSTLKNSIKRALSKKLSGGDFDILTYISELDAKYDGVIPPEYGTFILPNLIPQTKVSPSSNRRFILVGTGKYLPNRRSVQRFIRWGIPEMFVGTETIVIGEGFKKSKSANPKFVGYVNNISDFMMSNDIHIALVDTPAGIKGKVAQPFSYGLDVVTTAAGANGLARASNLHIINDRKSLVETLNHLLNKTNIVIQPSQIYCVDETERFVTMLNSLIKN